MLVVIAALPCVFMALYNTGLQANLALDPAKAATLAGWRHDVLRCARHRLLAGEHRSPASSTARCTSCRSTSVTMVVGLSWEVLFAVVRRRRGQRGLLRHRHPVPADPAADHAAVAGGARHQLRRRAGEGGLRRHRDELRQSGARRARVPVLRLSGGDLRRHGLDGRCDQAHAVDGFSGATLLAQMRQTDRAVREPEPARGGTRSSASSRARWARPRRSRA